MSSLDDVARAIGLLERAKEQNEATKREVERLRQVVLDLLPWVEPSLGGKQAAAKAREAIAPSPIPPPFETENMHRGVGP